MKTYNYLPEEEILISNYDQKNHHYWNEALAELTSLRLNLRKHYLKEQQKRCCYCKMLKQESHGMTWDVEHIVPKAVFPHFLFEPLNLSLSCKECNDYKKDKNVFIKDKYEYINYPVKNKSYAIIHPHLDVYSQHMDIKITPNGHLIHYPKTLKGKNTFNMCDLVRFSMEANDCSALDKDLLIKFSDFMNNQTHVNADIAVALFQASLPQRLPSEAIDC